jgi:beta-lactam-binding protein with PASTA domain
VRTIATFMSAGACVVAALMTGACDSGTSPSEPSEPSKPSEGSPTATAPPAPTEREQGSAPATPAGDQWTMPDLVGATLQDAQDQIQALTGGAVYFTESHDLSGEDRNQVMDANWKVCTQNVAAGAPLTTGSRIDFGVVKTEEACR